MDARFCAWLLVLLGVCATAYACTEQVQLARKGSAHTISPPVANDAGEHPSAAPTRDDFCTGRGLPVAAELLAPSGTDSACVHPAARLFRYALCTCADAVVTGALAADAFDSSRAPYAPGQSGASLGANAQLIMTGPVELLGSVTMNGTGLLVITITPFHLAGTLKTGGDLSITAADTRIGRDLWVQGEILALATNPVVAGDVYQPPGRSGASGIAVGGQLRTQELALSPPCPCGADQQLDVGAIVAEGRAHNDNAELGVGSDALYQTGRSDPLALECGRYAFDGGAIDDDARITARGRSALFIHGDLAISGRFAPDLGSTGEMDVFIDGALVLAAGATLGSIERPAALRVYVGGAGDLGLTGPMTLAAGLYAPQATMYLTAEQSSYGALLLAGFYASGDQSFHYDSALLHARDDASAAACGAATPAGGCSNDSDCVAPFVCQAQQCSSALE